MATTNQDLILSIFTSVDDLQRALENLLRDSKEIASILHTLDKHAADARDAIERLDDVDVEKDRQVFNPGAHVAATVTLSFAHASDAAWLDGALLEAKKTGRISPCMAGILRDTLAKVSQATVKDSDGCPIAPETLLKIRIGDAVLNPIGQ